jgi:4-amino-4-deoxy-L-arabinose transferase-like glycosyltransferase
MKSKRKKAKKAPAPQKVSKKKKTALSEFFNTPFFSTKTFQLLLFCFILAIAFIAGVLFLSSDPPHISWSQDVATDPPQYTYFARNQALWGEWDLFGHNRFVFFLKSFSSVASLIVFSILGTGRFQANLVAVILNLLTMVFLFLALKKVFGKRTAFLSFFLLGINFVFIMYGRNPFLEISAMFLLTLGFYFLVSSLKRNLLLLPSGICFAAGIFFGKTMAAFILPACAGVFLLWFLEQPPSEGLWKRSKPFALFCAGFILVLLFWIFFAYLPAKREVAGYFGEQALGLYGFPRAWQSLSGFVDSLFTFGKDLFFRMPVVFILSFLGLLLFFRNRPSLGRLFKLRDHQSKAKFFLILWFVGGFFLLMSLNYRPLRYQLYLIPPMCALAGLWLDSLIRSFNTKREPPNGILFWISFVVAVAFLVNYAITTMYRLSAKPIQLASSLVISVIVTLVLGGIYYWLSARSPATAKAASSSQSKTMATGHRILLVLVLLLVSLVVNGWQYVSWASLPTYSLNRSSVDLGRILSDQAVISGPYGPALVWDNKLKNIIHMFGVSKPDPQLFHTYPITHLALERGGNRDRAFQDYPQVMNQAKIVATYWLRHIPVDIYRIGEHTGNPETTEYPLSDFERAKLLMEAEQTDLALALLEDFVSRHPENYSGHHALAQIHYDRGEYQRALLLLEKAAEFHPTDFVIHQLMGAVYFTLASQTGQESHRLSGIEEWEKALELFPQNSQLAEQLRQIKGY